jgi:peptide/nickel transport system substrate-binding protein
MAAIALLAACSAPQAPGAAGSRNSWTHPGELRYGSAYEPDTLNPLLANTQAANDIAYVVFEPIFRYDADGEFVPAAVTEVPTLRNGGISADGKTIVLHFRPGMHWSDGAPYDARDLVFTWHAVMSPRNNTRLQTGWDDIASMRLRDNDTVTITLKRISSSILGSFAVGGSGYPPLPAHLLATLPDINQAPFNSRPISSGPFVLTAWNHGASLEFAPNPFYWRGKPGLQRLSYVIVPNADTLFSQLQTHEVDVDEAVGENEIPRLAAIPGTRVTKALTANWRRLAFNLRRPQLQDVRVRLAVAEAVDWDRMNQTIFHGYDARAVSDPAVPARSRRCDASARSRRLARGSGRDARQGGSTAGLLGLDHQRQTIERTGRSADAAGAARRRHRARDQELSRQPAVRARRPDLSRHVRLGVHHRDQRARPRQRRGVERSLYPATRHQHVVVR